MKNYALAVTSDEGKVILSITTDGEFVVAPSDAEQKEAVTKLFKFWEDLLKVRLAADAKKQDDWMAAEEARLRKKHEDSGTNRPFYSGD